MEKLKNISDEIVVVVPTIREANIQAFLAAWKWPCQVIVIEDNPEPTFQLSGCDHYSWRDIDRDLGDRSWIIPRRTDCIRSYGYWRAYQTGKPYIATLDDDCLPARGQQAYPFLRQHMINLQPTHVSCWHNTLEGAHPRGYPYGSTEALREVAISHGLWECVTDFDSISQLYQQRTPIASFGHAIGTVPCGRYFPMCGMNLAWRREITPIMYFLLMGQNTQGTRYPFDRFGDIWAGVIAKKILDHLGMAVWSGAPVVHHARASSVWVNLEKEHAGIAAHESFWRCIDSMRFRQHQIVPCYREVAGWIGEYCQQIIDNPGRGQPDASYWLDLSNAMLTWADLFATAGGS